MARCLCEPRGRSCPDPGLANWANWASRTAANRLEPCSSVITLGTQRELWPRSPEFLWFLGTKESSAGDGACVRHSALALHWVTPALAGHQLMHSLPAWEQQSCRAQEKLLGTEDLCAAVMSTLVAPPPAELQGCPYLGLLRHPWVSLQGHYFVGFSHFSHGSTLEGSGTWQAGKAKLRGM